MSAPRSFRGLGRLALSLISLALTLGACERGSNLSQEAEDDGQVGADGGKQADGKQADGEQADGKQADDGPSKPISEGNDGQSGGAEPEWPKDEHGLALPALDGDAKLINPGAAEHRVELRLGLVDGARYRLTTLGMLHLPLIDKPTGFAREEELSLGKCEGEGKARSCLLSHGYRNYEAEPPTGEGLEKEERQVAALKTAHRVDASGLRLTATAVEGPSDQASAVPGQQLTQVHRMFCIRLPAEPVGEGATWKDVCRLRQAGTIVTRELTWQLSKLETTPDGTRAELQYAGAVSKLDAKGERVSGQVQGMLYFWVDAGEPHMLRERLQFVLDAGKGLSSGVDLRVQFSKLGADGETLLRTDGKPFEQPPTVLNDPRTLPNGDTRDAELPVHRKR